MPNSHAAGEEITKVHGVEENAVREALQGARRQAQPVAEMADEATGALKLAVQRRHAEKLLALHGNGSCGSSGDLEKLRVQSQTEMRQLLQQHKAHVCRRSAAKGATLRSELESWRRLNEQLSRHHKEQFPSLNFNFVILDTPAFMLPSQDITLLQAAPAPWNNVARITGQWSSPYPDNGSDSLSYVFAWQNPGERYALINVASYLSVNGFCDAAAGPGYTHSILSTHASLQLFEWWNNPPTQPPGQGSQSSAVLFLAADGGGIFGLGDVVSAEMGGNYDVSYNMFVVPPKAVAVFTVSLEAYHHISGEGYVDMDLASGSFELMCPAVVIAILS